MVKNKSEQRFPGGGWGRDLRSDHDFGLFHGWGLGDMSVSFVKTCLKICAFYIKKPKKFWTLGNDRYAKCLEVNYNWWIKYNSLCNLSK